MISNSVYLNSMEQTVSPTQQSETIEPVQPMVQPPQQSTVPAKPKSRFLVFLIALLLLLSLGAVAYGMYQNYRPTNPPMVSLLTPTVSVSQAPIDGPLSDWKTFTKSDWSFRYPPNLFAKEPVPNFVDLVDSEDAPASNARISIDARMTGPSLNDFDEALKRRTNGLDIINPQTKTFPYGVIISGKIGPGMGEGLQITNGLVKYKNGAISVEYVGTNSDPQTFEQILSTFTLTGQSTASTPTPAIPSTWKAHLFDTVGLAMYAPDDWQSSIADFPENSDSLIKFWKKSSPTIVPIQLVIKPNWDNTGDTQTYQKNYVVAGNIPAIRIDPPKKEVQTLERYQTNVFFEYQNKVYVFECVHNWTQDYLETCDTMLKTLSFTR
jgi:hypothetical protein